MAGIRDSKTVGSTVYSYLTQNGKVVRQTWGSHTLDIIYDNQGNPSCCIYDGTKYIYVLNLQGDVIRLVSITGSTVASYVYDAWGNIISSSGTMAEINPIRYRGYYYDTETKLYYLGSRYYDPAVKRFLTADGLVSTGQGFVGYNMYAYCNNSPVVYTDSVGYIPNKNLCVADNGVSPSSVKDKLRQLEAKKLVQNTVITPATTSTNKPTYNASISNTYYGTFSNDNYILRYYSHMLEDEIESMCDQNIDYDLMDAEHIYYELEAHIVVWDLVRYSDLGGIVASAKQSTSTADLNVDEDRLLVTGIMKLLKLVGG